MIVQMASSVCLNRSVPVCLMARSTHPETNVAPSVSHGKWAKVDVIMVYEYIINKCI